jgi:hypothetical protein
MDNIFDSIAEVVRSIPDNWDRIVTVILALWGSILSTIIFLQDRPRIKTGVDLGFGVGGIEGDFMTFSVINHGRRPVTISNFSIKTKDNNFLLLTPSDFLERQLPSKLEENEDARVTINYNLLLNSEKPVKSFIFKDNTGREYRKNFDKKQFKELFLENE